MHNMTTNPILRDAIDRAHAERNAAVRAFFTALFTRKPSVAALAAQPA